MPSAEPVRYMSPTGISVGIASKQDFAASMLRIGGPLPQDCGVDGLRRRDTTSSSHMLELTTTGAMLSAERYRSSSMHDVCASAHAWHSASPLGRRRIMCIREGSSSRRAAPSPRVHETNSTSHARAHSSSGRACELRTTSARFRHIEPCPASAVFQRRTAA